MLNAKLIAPLIYLAAFSLLPAQSKKASEPEPYAISQTVINRQAKDFAPARKAPVFKGEFSVGLIPIRFPDTASLDTAEALTRLSDFSGTSLENYYKDYSQGITWPRILFVSDAAYVAPRPLGYYCEHHPRRNPLGYANREEGLQRVEQLKKDANAAAFRKWKRPAGLPAKADGKPHVLGHVYQTTLQPPDAIRSLIHPLYPASAKTIINGEERFIYAPAINWRDPLWPNSSVQINSAGDGGTLCHELGHVLGAPDFYHASEPCDGLPGTPTIPWAFGPTGPGYCRVIHQAFLPQTAYPMLVKDGVYTLHPRKTSPAEGNALGAFIPSIHPNYLFCAEYVHGEKAPLGNPGKSGLVLHVINVTLPDPFLGPPDLCYTYRPGDPLFLGFGDLSNALITSDFTPTLPNLLEGGITISDITENADSTLTFTLKRNATALNATALRQSLLPKIRIDEVTEILSTSLYASATILFRGEPLNTEYGFCFDTMPNPTCKTNNTFPLYHRDRTAGRILGLRPATTYHIRAYIKNARGITYSDKTLTVKTLPATPIPSTIEPLLTDKIGSWTTSAFSPKSPTYETGYAAPLAFTKLAAYYRAPLDTETRTPAFNYTRIHTSPSESRPPFRMTEFKTALHTSATLAVKAGLNEQFFTKTFDKTFAKLFGLRGKAPIEPLTEGSIARLAPLIRSQLAQSAPVIAIQESETLSPINQALMPVIIDGYRGDDEFHLVYPDGHDRVFTTRGSGWYPLTALLDQTTQVRLVFGLTPPSKRR